jgi:intraflagellar transport protein 81
MGVSDEKTPQELLQTLNNVLKDLSKEHDVRDEPIEQTAQRIYYYFNTLKYSYPGDLDQFQMALINGDRDTIYPLLYHMLNRLPDLRKRAYIAPFLEEFEVPEDMFADQEVLGKHTEYKDLQRQFRETHQRTDKLKSNNLQPTELKKEVRNFEEEKTQINDKINKLRQQLKHVPNYPELYNVVSCLRKEQEEEEKLLHRKMEQTDHLQKSEARFYQSQKQLQDLQISASQGLTGEDMIARAQNDVAMTRNHCEQILPQQSEEKKRRLDEVAALSILRHLLRVICLQDSTQIP